MTVEMGLVEHCVTSVPREDGTRFLLLEESQLQPTGLDMVTGLDSTLWKSWVGFILSHALGVIAIAATIMFHALDHLDSVAGEPWFFALIRGLPSVVGDRLRR